MKDGARPHDRWAGRDEDTIESGPRVTGCSKVMKYGSEHARDTALTRQRSQSRRDAEGVHETCVIELGDCEDGLRPLRSVAQTM